MTVKRHLCQFALIRTRRFWTFAFRLWRRSVYEFYHIWAWQQFRSYDEDHPNKAKGSSVSQLPLQKMFEQADGQQNLSFLE